MSNFIKKLIIYIAVPLILMIVIAILGFTCLRVDAAEVVLRQPDVSTTVDSVTDEITYSVTYDATTNTNVLNINVDAFGTTIYDDPETKYIDGIRLNDNTVESLVIPIDLSAENKIVVRTVYKDDLTGTLAQIADGTYDYTKLLENPLALLMGLYYVASLISIVAGMFGIARSRKKKVKTYDEITANVDVRAKEAFTNFSNAFMDEFKKAVEPVFKTLSDTQVSVVESITLMNSKDPSSHLQALDCLKRVAGTDVQGVLDTVHSELEKSIENAHIYKENSINTLTKIAETAQEESANGTLPIL